MPPDVPQSVETVCYRALLPLHQGKSILGEFQVQQIAFDPRNGAGCSSDPRRPAEPEPPVFPPAAEVAWIGHVENQDAAILQHPCRLTEDHVDVPHKLKDAGRDHGVERVLVKRESSSGRG